MELLQLSEARTYRILAIDDDPTCTELTRLALEGAGSYVVREVNDPEMAVAEAAAFAPDLVIMDVNMPHLDGRAAALLIQCDNEAKNIPVLFMTSMAPEGESAGNNPFGWFGPLAKPVSKKKLAQVVDSILVHGVADFPTE
ncbi:MAG: response regulator [Chthoniobacter sp.]|uniref:response regulator n=1 Tax=Chthoniobacter sp. TaxID=2510640 RepID=UPI0032A2564D